MSDFISLSQAFAQWQEIAADIDKDDGPALSESWNDYTDSLTKDGELCALQYHYAPSFDDSMPGEGTQFDSLSDDREFILDAMGVTLSATFVPFSQSRNKGEKQPSLNWRVTLKHGARVVLADVDYMQGCAHAPAYSAPNLGAQHSILRDERLRAECESGKTGRYSDSIGAMIGAKPIDPPSVADVLYSLLQDASAIDCASFADWCQEYGYDSDSIKARATYDKCIATATALRASFGGKTLDELNELFEGM